MSAVTTGAGVSGALADKLEVMIRTVGTETGDSRWRLHLQLIHAPVPQYSVRIYAPDRHSREHTVTITSNPVHDIRNILENEAQSWKARVQPLVMGNNETATE